MDIQSFLNFSKTTKGLSNNQQSQLEYKTYLHDSNLKTTTLNNEEKEKIRQQYISAIEFVLLNLTSETEKAYFKSIDLNNNDDLSTLIPLVASKLKQISLFIAKERERSKFSVIKYNLKGSEFGTVTFVKNRIFELYNDIDFTSRFSSFPSLSSINYIDTSITYYYNDGDDYFDKDYKKGLDDPGLYNGGKYEDLNLLYFNQDLYFPDLSGNIIKQYNLKNSDYLTTSTGRRLVTKSKLKVKRVLYSSDINNLDTQYFLYGEKSEENLIFNIIKHGVSSAVDRYGSNKFLGNNLYYVSSANTVTPMSGLLVEAVNRYSNILNFRNYTLQAVPNYDNLRSLQQIGGFFLPYKQGLSIALSKHYSYLINPSLSGTNVTTDPSESINIRGNSKLNYPKVWTYEENPAWIINDLGGQYNWGKIKNIRNFQKFNGYQSYEEDNYEYKSGINKTIESFDFFTGPEKSVWGNSDVYRVKIPNPVPLQEREDSYNVGKFDIYRWQGDIFGNNFALFKTYNNYDPIKDYPNNYNSKTKRNLNDFTPLTGVTTATDNVAYLYRNGYNTLTQSLCTEKAYNTIDEKKYVDGEIKVKTFNNTATVTLTAAFSAVFSKYPTATKQEINNKVITFNIIEDVIIIKTENYKIMERFKFDYNKNVFAPFYPFQTNLQ